MASPAHALDGPDDPYWRETYEVLNGIIALSCEKSWMKIEAACVVELIRVFSQPSALFGD